MSNTNGFDPNQKRDSSGKWEEYKAPVASGTLTIPATPGPGTDGWTPEQTEQAVNAYENELLWVDEEELREQGWPGEGDFDETSRKRAARQVEDFLTRNRALLAEAMENDPHYSVGDAASDFCLTRNGEGSGFWDRGMPSDIGDRLTASAHQYGEQRLTLGADGLLRFEGGTIPETDRGSTDIIAPGETGALVRHPDEWSVLLTAKNGRKRLWHGDAADEDDAATKALDQNNGFDLDVFAPMPPSAGHYMHEMSDIELACGVTEAQVMDTLPNVVFRDGALIVPGDASPALAGSVARAAFKGDPVEFCGVNVLGQSVYRRDPSTNARVDVAERKAAVAEREFKAAQAAGKPAKTLGLRAQDLASEVRRVRLEEGRAR